MSNNCRDAERWTRRCQNLNDQIVDYLRSCWQTERRQPILRAGCFMSANVFEKIIAREIPADIVYEDDLVVAFRDINRQGPGPSPDCSREKTSRAWPKPGRTTPGSWAILLLKAAEVAEKAGLKKTGYRLVINNGADAGESVPHLHCHILGGRKWRGRLATHVGGRRVGKFTDDYIPERQID